MKIFIASLIFLSFSFTAKGNESDFILNNLFCAKPKNNTLVCYQTLENTVYFLISKDIYSGVSTPEVWKTLNLTKVSDKYSSEIEYIGALIDGKLQPSSGNVKKVDNALISFNDSNELTEVELSVDLVPTCFSEFEKIKD